MDFEPNNSYTNPAKATGNVHKGSITISFLTYKVSYLLAFAFFVYDGEGHHCSRGRKEKLDLKLIPKQSYKSERTDESDSHLEVSEDDYNPEINESSDSGGKFEI